jgi:elongator complex protein 1
VICFSPFQVNYKFCDVDIFQALDIFPKGSPRYLDIATIYGDYLMDKKLYHEAGIMYTRAREYHNALTAYQVAGDWRETLLIANQLQYK